MWHHRRTLLLILLVKYPQIKPPISSLQQPIKIKPKNFSGPCPNEWKLSPNKDFKHFYLDFIKSSWKTKNNIEKLHFHELVNAVRVFELKSILKFITLGNGHNDITFFSCWIRHFFSHFLFRQHSVPASKWKLKGREVRCLFAIKMFAQI